MHNSESPLTIRDYDLAAVGADFYNTILPAMQCNHCGLYTVRSLWAAFETSDRKLTQNFFEVLLCFPENQILTVFENMKAIRYCCKMTILNTYLVVKRLLIEELRRLENVSPQEQVVAKDLKTSFTVEPVESHVPIEPQNDYSAEDFESS